MMRRGRLSSRLREHIGPCDGAEYDKSLCAMLECRAELLGRRRRFHEATLLLRELDDIATLTRHVTKRGDKVYFDYLQNRHGQLIVAPFSWRRS